MNRDLSLEEFQREKFAWQKLDNSKETNCNGRIPKQNLKGQIQRDTSHRKIPKGNFQLDNFNGKIRFQNNVELETSNGRSLLGKVQRENIKGKLPMGKLLSGGRRMEEFQLDKGNFQWDNSKRTL